MATAALPALTSSPSHLRRNLRLCLREARFELLGALRKKSFSLSVIGFPVMFYLLFGVSGRGATLHGQDFAKYLLASYTVFGAVGAALFGVGVGLALERSSGWLTFKRASPMPPFAYVFARCTMAIAFSTIILCVLCGVGSLLAGVRLSAAEFARMLAVTVAGSVPFAGMGLLLATLLPPNAAPGLTNMIYLPMSYCSGLWIPLSLLPRPVQHLAPFLPTYHLSQLMFHAIGYAPPNSFIAEHILALVAFTALFLGAAAFAYKRSDMEA